MNEDGYDGGVFRWTTSFNLHDSCQSFVDVLTCLWSKRRAHFLFMFNTFCCWILLVVVVFVNWIAVYDSILMKKFCIVLLFLSRWFLFCICVCLCVFTQKWFVHIENSAKQALRKVANRFGWSHSSISSLLS